MTGKQHGTSWNKLLVYQISAPKPPSDVEPQCNLCGLHNGHNSLCIPLQRHLEGRRAEKAWQYLELWRGPLCAAGRLGRQLQTRSSWKLSLSKFLVPVRFWKMCEGVAFACADFWTFVVIATLRPMLRNIGLQPPSQRANAVHWDCDSFTPWRCSKRVCVYDCLCVLLEWLTIADVCSSLKIKEATAELPNSLYVS